VEDDERAAAPAALRRRRLELSARAPLVRPLAGLARWGNRNRRDLPWRNTRDPWWVLVSEVMLQQTQAARVAVPYERFVAQFPTPAACAAAEVGAIVRAWAGLGYNRRAIFLSRAAQRIVSIHGGAVPGNLAELRALPGVGEYTARAVLAFAFERDVGVVDTNVFRVLSRAVVGRVTSSREAQELADSLVPAGSAWAHNQAMLDLGAAHCTATPSCDGCPLRRDCAWAAAEWAEPDPARPPTGRRPPPFAGSDRQGRGRLVARLRDGAVDGPELARVAGWPDDAARARRIADSLVADGLARWDGGSVLVLA
jgi:A/G-specific adenine glycosylase